MKSLLFVFGDEVEVEVIALGGYELDFYFGDFLVVGFGFVRFVEDVIFFVLEIHTAEAVFEVFAISAKFSVHGGVRMKEEITIVIER